MVGPWNHRSFPVFLHLPVNAVCVALNSGFMWLRCIKPRLSGNLPQFPEIFHDFWNFPFCLKVFHFIQEPLRLSRNLLDSSEIFQTDRLLGNLQYCLEIFKTVWKSSRLSQNLPDFWEIFQTVQSISQTCTEIFQKVQKF